MEKKKRNFVQKSAKYDKSRSVADDVTLVHFLSG